MKINIVDDEPTESDLACWCRKVGNQWPPRHELELIEILGKAGWGKDDTDAAVSHFYPRGTSGPGLPAHYFTVGPGTGEIVPRPVEASDRVLTPDEHEAVYGLPNFSAMVVAGLVQYAGRHGLGGPNAQDSAVTTDGRVFPRNEFTEESRRSGDWAKICGFGDDSFRNRMSEEKPGATWRISRLPNGHYIVHLDDLPGRLGGSKRLRDEALKNHVS